jgi:plastocyanin
MMMAYPKTLHAILLSMFLAASSSAGSIAGTVSAKPPSGPLGDAAAGDAYASRRYKFVEKIDYASLRDFIVYIDQPVAEITPGAPSLAGVTTQKNANFEPHVLPVAVGTTVRWPNDDDIYHNVFSMSDTKEFDLGYYKKDKTPELVFDKVGRVDVFCAIHSKMHCIILVLPNAFFSAADVRGRYQIRDVPPGTYRVRAWHERLPSRTLSVTVPAEGEVHVDFLLGLEALPKS